MKKGISRDGADMSISASAAIGIVKLAKPFGIIAGHRNGVAQAGLQLKIMRWHVYAAAASKISAKPIGCRPKAALLLAVIIRLSASESWWRKSIKRNQRRKLNGRQQPMVPSGSMTRRKKSVTIGGT
jgi:hypothetical protein